MKSKRILALILAVITSMAICVIPVAAYGEDRVCANVSFYEASGNLQNANFPGSVNETVAVGTLLHFNVASGVNIHLKSVKIDINGSTYYQYFSKPGFFFRWTTVAWTPDSPGEYSIYFEVTDDQTTYVGTRYVVIDAVDYTNTINQYLFANFYEDFGQVVDVSGTEIGDKLYRFYINVCDKAKYDIKYKENWNQLFPDVPYGEVVYAGKKVDPEMLGNIIYGIMGTWLNFSPTTLYQGGGYAASGTDFLKRTPENEMLYYGDSKEDHEMIQFGISLAGSVGTLDFDWYSVRFLLLLV